MSFVVIQQNLLGKFYVLSYTLRKEHNIVQNKTLHKNIFQCIFEICATQQPSDEGCWTVDNGKIIVDLARAPELAEKNGAIRFEKKDLSGKMISGSATEDIDIYKVTVENGKLEITL